MASLIIQNPDFNSFLEEKEKRQSKWTCTFGAHRILLTTNKNPIQAHPILTKKPTIRFSLPPMTGIFSSSTVRFQSHALISISRRRSKPSSSSSPSFFTTPRISASATSVRPSPSRKSPYEVLKVKETATVVEIKNAYRSLAKRFHPDASGGSGRWDEFVRIHDAYATLSDPQARTKYDEACRPEEFYHREMSTSAATEGAFGRVIRTRRWETDQCW